MEMPWKQFAAWVIGLKRNPFEKARLRLTGYYILVVAIILAAFSFFSYVATVKNINDRFERDAKLTAEEQQILSSTTDQLQITLLLIDAGVLVLTAVLSYILAGKTLKPIKTALDAQAQFTADASHEFRTPLSIIKYNGDVALKNPHLQIAEAREIIHSNIEEAEHMSVIVERLLMLARSEDGWNDLKKEKLELKNMVEKAVSNMRVLAEQKDISLALSDMQSGLVMGNPTALDQMILNILQNAIDYSHNNGSIAVSLTVNDNRVIFIVTDTGIGIEQKDLPHIFERFYKSDKARTMKQGGGLGLSIVQSIVKQHDGIIEIKSTPGKGTTVEIYLPQA